MDSAYGQEYHELYRRHWWWRSRERLILERLSELQPADGWGRILDVGCGDGLFFDELSRLGDVDGVEPDAALVTPGGRWRDRITVQPFDASFSPAHRYRLILFLDVLEHIEHPDVALRYAASLLEPEGYVVITVPASMRLWSSHDVLNRHFRRYERDELAELVRGAGLEVRDVRHAFHWAYPVKRVAHFVERLFPAQPRPPRVPPGLVNRAFFALTRIEQVASRGTRIPFGSSLVLVAGLPQGAAARGA